MRTCYIVGAGEGFRPFVAQEGDLILAADGGCRHLAAHGQVPHVVIGDLDSCDALPEGVPVVRHPVRKDDTDMGLSLRYALERGYRRIRMCGALGGRDDHTFANYHLLFLAKEQGADARICFERGEIFCLSHETQTIHGSVGDTLSLFAWGGEARGVTLVGVEYPLQDGVLSPHHPLGVSNAFASGEVTVCVADGELLCFHTRE